MKIEKYRVSIRYFIQERVSYKIYASSKDEANAIALKMWREDRAERCINPEVVNCVEDNFKPVRNRSKIGLD